MLETRECETAEEVGLIMAMLVGIILDFRSTLVIAH
jgi:hypothetical protein